MQRSRLNLDMNVPFFWGYFSPECRDAADYCAFRSGVFGAMRLLRLIIRKDNI